MPFCANCGNRLDENMNFCPECGARAAAVSGNVRPEKCDYRVILLSVYGCSSADAVGIIRDMFRYTAPEAKGFIKNMPCEIVRGLNGPQAATAAQVLIECGMNIEVRDGDGYADLKDFAVNSVFDGEGRLLDGAFGIISTISDKNKVKRIDQKRKPGTAAIIFAPGFRRPPPPKPARRPAAKKPKGGFLSVIRPKCRQGVRTDALSRTGRPARRKNKNGKWFREEGPGGIRK